MRSKVGEIRELEGETLNQSPKTKITFDVLHSGSSEPLQRNNLLQECLVQRHMDYFQEFSSLCRKQYKKDFNVKNVGSYDPDFFYITLRIHNKIISETNFFSRKSLVKDTATKFIQRVNKGLGVKREDKVGKNNIHYVAHAATFIEDKTKHGNTDFHHAHIVLGLYETQTRKFNTELIGTAIEGAYCGDFGAAMRLDEMLQSILVQSINIKSSSPKRYEDLRRVLHYSSKHCGSDEFDNFTNRKMTIRDEGNGQAGLYGTIDYRTKRNRKFDGTGILV
jgi:hypothetical protein